ncbi:MAG TPA: glycosyltransferase, partial [Acidimicrobiales bacterium]|nr:glycosyltransferase [Acidimicrobiales bacterium]
STARNLGIASAAGEIVAFLDDDAIPDGEWLDDLVPAFEDSEVGATGGPVFDHTGHQLQALYSLASRWGDARIEFEPKRIDYLDHPDTWYFPYTIGTNSLLRRDLVIGRGGFDENYAYYLDETDLCLRLIDRGYRVVPQVKGVVYHKFLSSDTRTENRVPVDRFNMILSRAYFARRHGLTKSDDLAMTSAFTEFVRFYRTDLEWHLEAGNISEEIIEKFNRDVTLGWQEARQRAERPPLIRSRQWFDRDRQAFLLFPTKQCSGERLRICLVTEDYPPGSVPGIGRASHTLATGLAAAGHFVHVISRSDGHNTVDLEDGVWVHRIRTAEHDSSPIENLPQSLWDRSASVLDEIRRIDRFTPVDLVQVPNWDAEGLAVILDGHFRVCLYAYTPILAVAEHDSRLDPRHPQIAAIAEAERVGYERAEMVLVSFPATLDQLERLYGVQIPAWRSAVVPLALPDRPAPSVELHEGTVEVLFVGRLEPRKGIDTLLAAVPRLCATHPEVRFTIVGDDSIVTPEGQTYRQAFEAASRADILERVRFTGSVSDDELMDYLARCDIFVAPSRFESFGLMNLEAMRFAKPVVSTMVNGVSAVVTNGEDGLLVPPGDPTALAAALEQLIVDPATRARLGSAARRSFETSFNISQMVHRTIDTYRALLEGRAPPSRPEPATPEAFSAIHPLTAVAAERQRRLLEVLRCPRCGAVVQVHSQLSSSDGRIKTGSVTCPACEVTIAAIRSFQLVLAEGMPEAPAGESGRVVAEVGEYRLRPMDGPLSGAGWDAHPDCWTGPKVGGTLVIRAPCTDIRVRLVNHTAGGSLRIEVDGSVVDTIDTRAGPGSVSRIVDVATDLEMAAHEVVFTVTDLEPNGHVIIQELVLLGPRQPGSSFTAPMPFARANPHSDRILDLLLQCDRSQLILECGGGDRRVDRPNHINLEFLPYEGADLRGADIHRLPFGDDAFDIVLSQAVLEHVAHPEKAAQEMIRVCKPGGLILSEVAFMQPLHGVPYHFYNMTQWGVEELFSDACAIEESDWFGELSFTLNWLLDASGITTSIDPDEREDWRERFSKLDQMIDHDALKAVASGIWVVARKR